MHWLIEHKRFVLFVLLTFILLIVEYYFFVIPIQQETVGLREEQFKIRSEIETKVKKGVFIADKSIQNAEEELKLIGNRYSLLKNKINFKPSSGYQLPTLKRPDDLIINFQSLLKDAQKRLEKTSAQKGVPIPSKIEFPLTNSSPDIILLYYERLDMIEQLVNLAMDSGCQRIISFGVTDADFKEFKDVKEIVIKTNLMTKNMVFIKLNGSFNTILQFINLLGNAERFISVEKVIMENTNPDSDSLNATFIIASVKLTDIPVK